MTQPLSAAALARFADDFRLRPDEAVTFVRNADPIMRQRIAEKYGPAPARSHPDAATVGYALMSDVKRRDAMAMRQAMASAVPVTSCPKCRAAGWTLCEHTSQHERH